MSFRRAAKTDANHAEIVAHFRSHGWSVLNVSQLKHCCDIFVSKGGETIAIEIKDGSKIPSARKLTEGEKKFKRCWQGKYAVIENTEEVDRLVQMY